MIAKTVSYIMIQKEQDQVLPLAWVVLKEKEGISVWDVPFGIHPG
jgi:hypothetical protein